MKEYKEFNIKLSNPYIELHEPIIKKSRRERRKEQREKKRITKLKITLWRTKKTQSK